MDYKERYEQALEKARKLMNKGYDVLMPEIFPELQEDKDERIRKELTEFLKSASGGFLNSAIQCETFGEWLAWLEKQGEKLSVVNFKAKDWYVSKVDGKIHNIYENSTNNDELKFKVGDLIKHNKANIICKVISVNRSSYYIENIETSGRIELFNAEQNFHLWTLQDAKEGDILAFDDNTIVIFKDLYNATSFHSYCHIEDGLFGISKDGVLYRWEGEGFYPATKEQRDLLFEKMAQAGWKWNSEEKELKKIEDKTLDADEVIDWLKPYSVIDNNIINCFKKDF